MALAGKLSNRGNLPKSGNVTSRDARHENDTLRRLEKLDIEMRREFLPDADFEALASLAARSLNAPIAVISLIDADVHWRISGIGLDAIKTGFDAEFCSSALSQNVNEALIVEDVRQDKRFSDSDLITESPSIRFFAGMPIVVEGEKVGVLCVFDQQVREAITDDQLSSLCDVSDLASSLFKLKLAKTSVSDFSGNETKRLLMEINHRVNNTLSIVQSLSAQTAKVSLGSDTYNRIFLGRVQAISLVHDLLSEKHWSSAPLREVAEVQFATRREQGLQISTDIPNPMLVPDAAIGLGLMLHELLSCFDREREEEKEMSGRCHLAGKITETNEARTNIGPVLNLTWTDERPFPVDANHQILEHRLKVVSRTLGKILGSHVSVNRNDNGLTVDIILPLEA